MMYRCENCGHLFEEGEQAVWEERHGLDTPPYEKCSGCPICGGTYEKVHQCAGCGDWHSDDELYEGWCETCLRESINYDTFFEYCEANRDEEYLDCFVMSEFFDMNMVDHSSYDFHQLIVRVYQGRVDLAQTFKFCEFLSSCVRFIMDDDGSIGRENYADWLNKREVK